LLAMTNQGRRLAYFFVSQLVYGFWGLAEDDAVVTTFHEAPHNKSPTWGRLTE